MTQTKNILNINDAKKEYRLTNSGKNVYKAELCFSQYSPSYVVTNEDVRWVSETTHNTAKRVLTTAGSGDHPIFYKLNGAEIVDTFDISFCAKVIMDIKTTAIKQLSRDQYINLLNKMYKANRLSSIPHMKDLAQEIPLLSAYFIKQMDSYQIFAKGNEPSCYKYIFPTYAEYSAMKQLITSPFNFIWCDLMNLHSKLIGKYDVINLSNILEYSSAKEIENVLLSLKPHLSKDGLIIAQTGKWGSFLRTQKTFCKLSENFKNWAKIYVAQKDKNDTNSEIMIALQKMR